MLIKIKKRKKMLGMITFFCLVLAAIFFFNEWNRAGLLSSSGWIDVGKKFEIEIGSSPEAARTILISKGLEELDVSINRRSSKTGSQNCHGQEYPDHIRLDGFIDKSGRRGIICIASDENKIIAISWHYGMFQL